MAPTCGVTLFSFFNGTSCCIELHQMDCCVSGRLSLRYFHCENRAEISGERDLFFKGKQAGEQSEDLPRDYVKLSFHTFFIMWH